MLSEKLKSPKVKFYIIIWVLVLILISFTIYFLKDYFSYYKSLFDYRVKLVSQLESPEVEKPKLLSTDPYIGNPKSKIVIFEYSDFSCKACKELQPILNEIVTFYGISNILLVYKDIPVTISPYAKKAHIAARCADEQGFYSDYHDQLFENQDNFNDDVFLEIANNLNLNSNDFKKCFESEKYTDIIDENLRDALRLGINATPTLFINNQEVVSGFNFQNLRNIIENTK